MASIVHKGKASQISTLWSVFRSDGYTVFPYAVIEDSSILSLVDDFTLEVIFKFNNVILGTKAYANGIVSADPGNGYPLTGWSLFHRKTATEDTLMFVVGTTQYTLDFSCVDGSEYHLALSRIGTTLMLWVNGSLSKTILNVPTSFNAEGTVLYLGSTILYTEADRHMDGIIKGVRLFDSAMYIDSFIPSTAW